MTPAMEDGTVFFSVRWLTIRDANGTAWVTSCVGRGTDSYSTPCLSR